MAELTVHGTYGYALYLAAKEVDKVQLIREEAKEVLSVLDSEPDFVAFINTPVIPAKEKKAVIDRVFRDKISDELLNLFFVLVDKGRAKHINKIFSAYEAKINEVEGFAVGKILSVVPLSKGQLKKFEEETAKLLQERIKLENVVDVRLLGGIKIFINGKVIDASLRNRLDSLTSKII
jgi:F-type H+-transporting ATPase subunit delta